MGSTEENLDARTQVTSLEAGSPPPTPNFRTRPVQKLTDRERLTPEEISRAEATMLKANWRSIYDGLCARSGAGALPFIAACCCVRLLCSFFLHLVDAGGIFPPCFGPRPAPFEGGASNKRTWKGNDQWLLPKVTEHRGRGVRVAPRRSSSPPADVSGADGDFQDNDKYYLIKLLFFCVTADSPIMTSV